jgi:endoglucanase
MDFMAITAHDFVRTVGFGINIGNTLDATAGRGLGRETSWGNPRITRGLLQAIMDKGINLVRIPVSWEGHIIGGAPDYRFNEEWMERVQEVVDWALEIGFYVILNTHHEYRFFYPAVSAENYEEAKEVILAMWGQIAPRFRGYSEKLIFNIMNEPRAVDLPSEWTGGNANMRKIISDLNIDALEYIRSSGGNNAERLVMITPIQAAVWFTEEFHIPDDPYVLVSAHAYEPYNFALNVRGTGTFAGPQTLNNLFNHLESAYISKGIPVIMDETGAMNKDNLDDRIEWAKEYSRRAAEINMPVVWWDNGVLSNATGGESFALINRRTYEWHFPELVEIFLEAYKR